MRNGVNIGLSVIRTVIEMLEGKIKVIFEQFFVLLKNLTNFQKVNAK